MINILITKSFCTFMVISLVIISRTGSTESMVIISSITKLCEVRAFYLFVYCYISRSWIQGPAYIVWNSINNWWMNGCVPIAILYFIREMLVYTVTNSMWQFNIKNILLYIFYFLGQIYLKYYFIIPLVQGSIPRILIFWHPN